MCYAWCFPAFVLGEKVKLWEVWQDRSPEMARPECSLQPGTVLTCLHLLPGATAIKPCFSRSLQNLNSTRFVCIDKKWLQGLEMCGVRSALELSSVGLGWDQSWINPRLYQSIPQFRVSTGISPLHVNNYFLGALRESVRLPSTMLYEKLLSPPLPCSEGPHWWTL